MFAAFILAATTGVASEFLDDFAGTWTCGNAKYHATWTIERAGATSNPWARVTFGDPKAPDGLAIVGWVAQRGQFVYNDYHADGTFSALTSPPAADGTFRWTGTYYPIGGAADSGPDTTWTLTHGTIVRHFTQHIGKTVKDWGGDVCTKA